jgi:hypothetical protein
MPSNHELYKGLSKGIKSSKSYCKDDEGNARSLAVGKNQLQKEVQKNNLI